MYTVACYGGRPYQISDHKNTFSHDSYISLRLFTAAITIIITLLFVISNGYDVQKSVLILLLVSQRVLDAIADVFYGIMQKNKNLHLSGKSLFYKSIISFVIFLIIDTATKNLLLSALSLPVISLLFIMFYDIPNTRKFDTFSIKFRVSQIKKIIKATFLPFSIAVMGLLFANIARYFIDIYHPHLQGYFGIIIMPLSLVILLFSFLLIPSMLQLSNKYNEQKINALHNQIIRITLILTGSTILICFVTYIAGIPLLEILFGVDFTKYIADILLVILIGYMLSITSLFTNIAIFARRLKMTSTIYVISNILLIVLCIFLIRVNQIHGAIIAYLISSAVQMLAMYIYYLKLTRHQRLSKNL